MVKINNRDELKAWLEGRDRETARAIASRAALRVSPFIVHTRRRDRVALLATTFRATSASETGPTAVARSAADASATAYAYAAADAPAYAYAAAADAAAYADAAAAVAYADAAAAYADAAYTNATAKAALWRSVSADVQFLDQGDDPRALMARPLWDGAQAPDHLTDAWAQLKDELSQDPNLHWDVWIDWYEARLSGGPRNWELERARSVIPHQEELWPDANTPTSEQIRRLNLRLKALEFEYTRPEIPPDDPDGDVFTVSNGVVVVVPPPDRGPSADDPDSEGVHADCVEAIQALIDAFVANAAQTNEFHPLGGRAKRLLQALGDSPATMNERSFIYRAAHIQNELRLDDAAQRDPDNAVRPPMSEAQRVAAEEADSIIAVYVSTDPRLSQLDAVRTRRADPPVNAVAAVEAVDGFVEDGAADQNALEALKEKAEVAPRSAGFGATALNLIKAVLRAVVVGAAQWASSGVAVPVANALVKHQAKIYKTLRWAPPLLAVAKWVIKQLEKIPGLAKDLMDD